MEEQDESLQLLIHLKKGIFQQQIRKRKIKQILSEKRRKDFQTILQNNELNKSMFQENEDDINKRMEYLSGNEVEQIICDIKEALKRENLKQIYDIGCDSQIIEKLMHALRVSKLDDSQLVLDILSLFNNLTYYLNTTCTSTLVSQLANSLLTKTNSNSNSNSMDSLSEADQNYSLLEQIATQHSKNYNILELIISLTTNIVLNADEEVFQSVINQDQLILLMIEIMQEKKTFNPQIFEELTHLIYNISLQKEFYSFSQMDDILYLIYLSLPFVINSLSRNRLIQSFSFILDVASQTQFQQFVIQNHHVFQFLSDFISQQSGKDSSSSSSSSSSNFNSSKDEESIQIILEIYLLSCEILDNHNDNYETQQLMQQIWLSTQNTFNVPLENAEITILSLKIMQSILDNTNDNTYYLNHLLSTQSSQLSQEQQQQQSSTSQEQLQQEQLQKEEQNDENGSGIKEIIRQCCEQSNCDIVNEFISFLCCLIKHSHFLSQIHLLIKYKLIFIFVESLKTDFLFYEVKDEIFTTLLYLFNLNDAFYAEGDICSQTSAIVKISLVQNGGMQVLENELNNSTTQHIHNIIEEILEQLEDRYQMQ